MARLPFHVIPNGHAVRAELSIWVTVTVGYGDRVTVTVGYGDRVTVTAGYGDRVTVTGVTVTVHSTSFKDLSPTSRHSKR
jgi:hypothetical protein